jgi:hypothetical protein
LSQLTSSLPSSLQGLASPTSAATSAAATTPTTLLQSLYAFIFGTTVLPTNLSAFVTAYSPYASFFYNTEGLPYFSVGMGNSAFRWPRPWACSAEPARHCRPEPAAGGLAACWAAALAALAGLDQEGRGLGNAPVKLAVPPSWIGGARGPACPQADQ